jgi:hypothetical protein
MAIQIKYLKGVVQIMKLKKRIRLTIFTLIVSFAIILSVSLVAFAAQATVDLGSTESFAILAGETITNTGTTTITGDAGGDIGLFPGTAITGEAGFVTSGTIYKSDPGNVASTAKTDLQIAYDDAAGRTPVTIIATELGGQTLTPGVYASNSGTFEINGTLTLDAENDPNGVFIFQTSTTLVTAVSSNVSLLRQARYCRIFWKIGSSATLGGSSHFVGHLFALQSITVNDSASINGQLLARNGSVTLSNNTIVNGVCNEVTPSPTPIINPDTGDHSDDNSWIMIALVMLAGLLVLSGIMAFLTRNRKFQR